MGRRGSVTSDAGWLEASAREDEAWIAYATGGRTPVLLAAYEVAVKATDMAMKAWEER